MDIDICKKCGIVFQLTETNYGRSTFACFGPNQKNACFLEFISSNEAFDILRNSEIVQTRIDTNENSFGTHNVCFVKLKDEIKYLINKDVYQTCPYFVEHQIFNLNRKVKNGKRYFR